MIGAAIQFLIIAAVVYFVLVLPVNNLLKRTFAKQQADETLPPTSPRPRSNCSARSATCCALTVAPTPADASHGSHAAPESAGATRGQRRQRPARQPLSRPA